MYIEFNARRTGKTQRLIENACEFLLRSDNNNKILILTENIKTHLEIGKRMREYFTNNGIDISIMNRVDFYSFRIITNIHHYSKIYIDDFDHGGAVMGNRFIDMLMPVRDDSYLCTTEKLQNVLTRFLKINYDTHIKSSQRKLKIKKYLES